MPRTLASARTLAGGRDYASQVLRDAPVGYWRLEEPSGNALDSSGNGLTGTAVGGITRSVPGPLPIADLGVTPNGTTGYYDLGNPALLQITGSFSVEFWVKGPANLTGDVMSKRDSGSAIEAWLINISAVTLHKMTFRVNNSGSTIITGVTSLDDNAWHHVVCVFKAGYYTKIFVDGVQDAQRTTTVTTVNNIASNARIGAQVAGNFFNGSIDEVAIYNKALTAAKVREHYKLGSNITRSAASARSGA